MRSERSRAPEGFWTEAWRLADPAYTELAFQAIYAVRQGNLPPDIPPRELAARARRRVLQSKALISGLLGFLSLGSLLLLNPVARRLFVVLLPEGLYVAAVLGALVVVEMILLWWTGLQVLPAYLASGIVPLLRGLPVSPKSLRRAALILLLRLFDAPVITCLVLTPIAAGIALRSAVAGLLLLPAVVAAAVFAIALALLSGRFFVRHVQGARGGTARTAMRWAYLVLWAIPAFAMYGFVAVGPAFLRYIAALALDGPTAVLDAIFLAFPFSLTTLPAFALGLPTAGPGPGLDPIAVLVGGALYAGLLSGTVAWLRTAPLRLSSETAFSPGPAAGALGRLSLTSSAGAVLRKDLRTASRTPGFAFLVLLPLLQAAALGIWTFVADPKPSGILQLASAAVESAALLATFFGPAFFAIEVLGYSYTRTLPLPGRSVVVGKLALVLLVYALASAIVVSLTLARVFAPTLFLAFVAAELPAIAAGGLLELTILFRRAEAKGLPITNLFAGAWWAAAVAVPGLLETGTPLLLYDALVGGTGPGLAIAGMAILASIELALVIPFALTVGRRGAA